jgi:hypothetical protein
MVAWVLVAVEVRPDLVRVAEEGTLHAVGMGAAVLTWDHLEVLLAAEAVI